MLPTEDNSKLYHHKREKRLGYWFKGTKPNYAEFQHLYILSDDEIKEGDWVLSNNSKKPMLGAPDLLPSKYKKIIATTDPIFVLNSEKTAIMGAFDMREYLPQIPQSLVKHYAKYQPEEVELEYEQVKNPKFRLRKKGQAEINYIPLYLEKLKLQNNEVVWVEPEIEKFKNAYNKANNLYSREEVEELCRKAMHFGLQARGLVQGRSENDIRQWLKENL